MPVKEGFMSFAPGVFNNAAASKPANWNIPGKMLEKGLARPAFGEKPAHLETHIHKELDAINEANVRLQLQTCTFFAPLARTLLSWFWSREETLIKRSR